jgi:hypothetical protein
MTEDGWNEGADPRAMLEVLRRSGRANERRLRLFACGCVRHIGHLLAEERTRQALELSERFADGGASKREVTQARAAAGWEGLAEARWVRAAVAAATFGTWRKAAEAAEAVARAAAQMTGPDATAGLAQVAARSVAAWKREREYQAQLLRDIFGNPFRPVPAVEPARLTRKGSAAAELAQAIYAERRFDDLPVLADALEEGGCANVELLGHLRRPGPHCLGCWGLDLLTGKG